MNDKEELTISPLFTALTRPPMIWGVTITYFYYSGLFLLCVFIGTLSFLAPLVLYPVLHLAGMIACYNDKDFFNIALKKPNCRYMPNRHIWGLNSYEPF